MVFQISKNVVFQTLNFENNRYLLFFCFTIDKQKVNMRPSTFGHFVTQTPHPLHFIIILRNKICN